jgi:fibronectin-binding autotransporter adhesin
MRRAAKSKAFALIIVVASAAAVGRAQTVINGSTMALKSSGAAANNTAWTLGSNGYLGTYIQVPSAGSTVSFDLNATGIVSNGVLPDVTLSVAGTNDPFSVTTAANGDYIASVTLPGDSSANANGMYAVRLQLDNQSATATPSVTINKLTVTGATVVNSNTDAIALEAAQTYADKFRSGPGTVTLSNSSGIHLGAGTSVQVKLTSNAFNFAAAVYGDSTFSNDSQWINVGSNGQNLAPTTTEQINYQNAIKTNFNMIVPANSGKWINNEFTQGSVNMNLTDAMTQFATQNGLRVRMHNVIWNTEQPSFISGMFGSTTGTGGNFGTFIGNQTTLVNDINSRANYYTEGNVAHVAGTARADNYTEMDVFNEPFHGQSAQVNYLANGALGISGAANVYKQIAADDAAVNANTRLYVNEYNVLQFSPSTISSAGVAAGSDNYANWYLNGVQSLQKAGAPIGGIGAELYVNTSNLVSAATMEQAMENLAVAKDPNGNPMPFSLTEFGVATGQTPTVANYDTDLQTALTMAYGDPQATTFGYWGGIGGPHDSSAYSLYDSNYNLTANGTTWQAFQSQYNTNLTLTTDANGKISFNGTYGTYQVTVDGQNYTLNLVPGTATYGLLTAVTNANWTGGGTTNNWSTANNWGTTAPFAGMVLSFGGATKTTNNNDYAAGTAFDGIQFASTAGAFVLNGNSINLGGNIVNNSASLQTINTPLQLLQTTTLSAVTGNLAVGGAITGNFGLAMSGPGSVTLSAMNGYTGDTNVNGGSLTIASGGSIASSNVIVAASSTLNINGSFATTPTLTVNGGTVNFGASTTNALVSVKLTAINLNSNALITVGAASPNRTVLYTSALNFTDGTGLLDLGPNDLIIHGGSLSTITSELMTGRNGGSGGAWTGSVGITSSAAATSSNTALGIEVNDDGSGHALMTSFDGVPVSDGDILVKYTFVGDADLSGSIDATDYSLIDNGFAKGLTGWNNGDFNYDSVVNGDDYTLIDNAFNTQGSVSFAAITVEPTETIATTASVPEPTSLVLVAIAAISLRSRRSRRI